MLIPELVQELHDLRISRSRYRIGEHGGGTSDTVVLEATAEGFEVFYDERGRRESLAKFADEADACAFVLAQLQSGRN